MGREVRQGGGREEDGCFSAVSHLLLLIQGQGPSVGDLGSLGHKTPAAKGMLI